MPDCVRGLGPRIAVVVKRTTQVHRRNADQADVCNDDIVGASLLLDSGDGDKRRLARLLRESHILHVMARRAWEPNKHVSLRL